MTNRSITVVATWASLLWFGAVAPLLGADTAKLGEQTEADKAALATMQPYIGQWRGMGQPQRGSPQGAWTEAADWAWSFADGRASLVFHSPNGKHLLAGKIVPGGETDEVLLQVTLAGSTTPVVFTGKREGSGQFVFNAPADVAGQTEVARISLRQVAGGDRLLMLLEKQVAGTQRLTRLAEIGYTRVGSGFGKGTNERECVVTGGQGTMTVMYQGQAYFVCCTGCRDLFQADPEGVLADYRKRLAEKANEAK